MQPIQLRLEWSRSLHSKRQVYTKLGLYSESYTKNLLYRPGREKKSPSKTIDLYVTKREDMKERAHERERKSGREERTERGRTEIAQACNKSRYRSMISLERALARIAVREKEMVKGREEWASAVCEKRGLVLVEGQTRRKRCSSCCDLYTSDA